MAEASTASPAPVLLDDSFAELSERRDLPDFDIIALHGVWTWISNEARRTIVDIVRRKLKVGGLLYVGYNVHPGQAPVDPLRRLMTFYSSLAPKGLGTLMNIDTALKYAQQLADAGAEYFKANPFARDYLGRISGRDRKYIAHELFNRDWELMTFGEMSEWLAPAKVDYATTAHLVDHFSVAHLPPTGQRLLASIKHPVLFEVTRDFLVNQRFRRDIFVKGPLRLSPLERERLLKEQAFVLTRPREDIPLKVKWVANEEALQESVYRPVIEVLADNGHAPKTLGELSQHPRLKTLPFAQLAEAVLVMTGAGHAAPAQPSSSDTRRQCAALNRHICDLAADGGSDIHCLASPVTALGVKADRLQQLLMLAICQNQREAEDQARFVWDILSRQGKFVKDGNVITSKEKAIAELTGQAQAFDKKMLPVLKALEVDVG
jgi:hypothetical protein